MCDGWKKRTQNTLKKCNELCDTVSYGYSDVCCCMCRALLSLPFYPCSCVRLLNLITIKLYHNECHSLIYQINRIEPQNQTDKQKVRQLHARLIYAKYNLGANEISLVRYVHFFENHPNCQSLIKNSVNSRTAVARERSTTLLQSFFVT